MNGVNRLDLSKFFVKAPLIPVVCQDERSGEVLMLGYANEQALQLTMDTGTAWFFSRSRQKLWNKGETSGNFIFVSRILSDCDDDTLIYVGTPKGPVCHTGHRTCAALSRRKAHTPAICLRRALTRFSRRSVRSAPRPSLQPRTATRPSWSVRSTTYSTT